MRRMMLRRRRS